MRLHFCKGALRAAACGCVSLCVRYGEGAFLQGALRAALLHKKRRAVFSSLPLVLKWHQTNATSLLLSWRSLLLG